MTRSVVVLLMSPEAADIYRPVINDCKGLRLDFTEEELNNPAFMDMMFKALGRSVIRETNQSKPTIPGDEIPF